MPDQIAPYLASEQFEREFSFEWEKKILWVTMAVSVLLILVIWILGGRGLPSGWVWLSVIACAGYVMNAILTGALANVYSRLQSRVAWLIPLAVCLYVISFLRKRQS
jgi:hypothetical protein